MALTATNLDQVQTALSKQPKSNTPWNFTLTVSPFCLLIRKELFGAQIASQNLTSKDICLSALHSGNYVVSASDTVVYHFPEALDLDLKHFEQDERTILAVVYRIKIDSPFIRDVFVKSLHQTVKFADKLYILDDNSKLKISLYMKENYPELWSQVTHYEKFSRPFDERRDLNDLIGWAEGGGCSWLLSLEADEVVEDKIDRGYMHRLMGQTNPLTVAYEVSHYHFWNDGENWRYDKPWGQMRGIRMARLIPGRRVTNPGIVAGICGYLPHYPKECTVPAGFRIKNYGYVKKDLREERKAFYEQLGLKSPDGKLIDFSYLTKENGVYVTPWVEQSTVSIYTPTKKGGAELAEWLDHVVNFADEIIIGDDGLEQDDVEALRTYPTVKIVPITMGDNFAVGRNACLAAATKDWILQLDLDERVDDLLALRRMMDVPQYNVWLFHIMNIQRDGTPMVTDTLRLFRNSEGVYYAGRLHETIDEHAKKKNWKASTSPTNIIHYGYVSQTPEAAYKKMQRYLAMNIEEMRENPKKGMPYYSVALHFLEDHLVDDAVKLLDIAGFLMPQFPLANLELGKTFILKAHHYMSLGVKSGNKDIQKSYLAQLKTLEKILPHNHIIAQGHCLAYFQTHPKDAEWLAQHIRKMEHHIDTARGKIMEKK